MDRFQDLSQVKNPARQRSNNYLELSKESVLGNNDAVTLNMIYLKVLHDIVSQNSLIKFSEAAIMF